MVQSWPWGRQIEVKKNKDTFDYVKTFLCILGCLQMTKVLINCEFTRYTYCVTILFSKLLVLVSSYIHIKYD